MSLEPLKKFIFSKRKSKRVITQDQKKAIRITTLPKDKAEDEFIIYGSYNYASQTWPSDIDGTELFTFCKDYPCNREKAEQLGVKVIQDLVKQIGSSKNVWLGDVKIGVDMEIEKIITYIQVTLYKSEIDPLWEEFLKSHKKKDKKRISHSFLDEDQIPKLLIYGYEVNFPQKEVLQKWKEAYNKGIISKEAYEKLENLVPKKIKGKEGLDIFFTYCEFVRNLLILRWTYDEIIQGRKLIGEREISLRDGVKSSVQHVCKNKRCGDIYHLIKVDMFAVTNGKVMEFSNVLSLMYKESTKKTKFLGLVKDPKSIKKEEVIEALKTDMAQYYIEISKKYKKPMKYAKRMYVISMLKKDNKVGKKLVLLFKSDINLLNNINSNLDTILAMLHDQENPPMDILYNQLDEQKFRISQITEIELDDEAFYNLINEIVKGKMKKEEIIKILEPVKKHFSDIIGDHVKEYLKKVKLWPGPYFSKDNLEFVYG